MKPHKLTRKGVKTLLTWHRRDMVKIPGYYFYKRAENPTNLLVAVCLGPNGLGLLANGIPGLRHAYPDDLFLGPLPHVALPTENEIKLALEESCPTP